MLAAYILGVGSGAVAAAPAAPGFDYFLVITGGELLEGALADAHTPFITRTLRPLGARCAGAILLDDRREEMLRALQFATNQAQIVIVTGGLGPTPNDITRETLAEFTGISLREHPAVLAAMEQRFQSSKDQLRPNLRRQTLVPSRGGYFTNAHGTAVGLRFNLDPVVIVALPGPPRELRPMVTDQLVPYLQRHFGARVPGAALTLRFVGLGQSQIDQTIKDHVPLPPAAVITSQFEGSRVDFTFTLPGNAPSDRAELNRVKETIRRRLGNHLYSEDGSSLEAVVIRKLRAQRQTLALVEVGSGGHLAAALNDTPDAQDVLVGAFAAPGEEAARHWFPSAPGRPAQSAAERTQALAAAVAQKFKSSWAIAVGPLEEIGPEGRAVPVALQSPDGTGDLRRFALRGAGEIDHANLVTQILDELRRQLP